MHFDPIRCQPTGWNQAHVHVHTVYIKCFRGKQMTHTSWHSSLTHITNCHTLSSLLYISFTTITFFFHIFSRCTITARASQGARPKKDCAAQDVIHFYSHLFHYFASRFSSSFSHGYRFYQQRSGKGHLYHHFFYCGKKKFSELFMSKCVPKIKQFVKKSSKILK